MAMVYTLHTPIPEPSSPNMWPHPPQRGATPPDGLSSWQLEPVPDISTIPPIVRIDQIGN